MIEGISGVPSASKHDSEETWLKSRVNTISASVVASCYPARGGESVGYDDPTTCWLKLSKGVDPDRFPAAGQGAAARNLLRSGEMLQPAIEQLWLDQNPEAVRVEEACERSFLHPEHSWLSATPDLVVRMPDGELLIVEIKATTNLKIWKDYNEFVVPRRVKIQVQAQMEVLGIPRSRVVLYPILGDCDGQPIWVSPEMTPEPDVCAGNLYWARTMKECVDTNTAPAFHKAYNKQYADYEIGIPAALATIHTTDVIEADEESEHLVSELAKCRSRIATISKYEKEVSAALKGKFGLASELRSKGRVIATYRGGYETDRPTIIEAAKRLDLDVEGLNAEEIVAAFPAIVAEDYTASAKRRLLIKDVDG